MLLAVLVASSASADPWTVVAPSDWTLDPDDAQPLVTVEWWFTEQGAVISPVSAYFLGPGRSRDVPVDPAYWESGRTICLHARARRLGPLGGTRDAAPLCVTFDADFSVRAPVTCPPTPYP